MRCKDAEPRRKDAGLRWAIRVACSSVAGARRCKDGAWRPMDFLRAAIHVPVTIVSGQRPPVGNARGTIAIACGLALAQPTGVPKPHGPAGKLRRTTAGPCHVSQPA